MERAKELGHLKDSKYREQYEKEKIQNNFDLSANDFQLAKHMQDLASDRQYQQVYDQGEFLLRFMNIHDVWKLVKFTVNWIWLVLLTQNSFPYGIRQNDFIKFKLYWTSQPSKPTEMIRVNNLSSVNVENSISRLLSVTSNQLVEFQHPFDIM